MSKVNERLTKVEAITEDINSTLHDQNLDDWLSPPDPSINYNEAKKKCHKDTCQWFLQSEIFDKWKTTASSFLWIHGLVACGKTVLSSTIVDALHEDAKARRTVLYYFFDYKETAKQSLDCMIRSLICQLYPASKETQQLLMKVFSSCHGWDEFVEVHGDEIHPPSLASFTELRPAVDQSLHFWLLRQPKLQEFRGCLLSEELLKLLILQGALE
ncbi:hypothetical protein SLS58_007332 [Diplodia intermedia]|uniref:Nephrocystin 3-like N-terminal domain-containing protein n=1 Tax=Diplodia intermedia TaxID=856260 RepID=A0ABR3TKR8_9PEZI